jgi:alkanesulfonate monooxygenase SsuD/methylene tetrahydromethanopterin reductase-like flavin-dependent oxidoreductase (luciferase family)
MRFSNFLFPEARTPSRDAEYIADALEEAKLTETLGFDGVWLAEHHFDGNCCYVDPVTFASAILASTQNLKVGFAVAQLSLHHPVRLAEQMSLLDNMSRGRLIVGIGKGTAYNIYEYTGYGIAHDEARERYEEAEQILIKSWTGEEGFVHEGKYWQLNGPALRPRPFTRPHPRLLRAASSENGAIELGKRGLPFLMNVQSEEQTLARLDIYKNALQESGFDEEHIAKCMSESWVWRNVYVGENDKEAEDVGSSNFAAMVDHRSSMRERVAEAQGQAITKSNPVYRDPKVGLMAGSASTVAERISKLADCGIGGVMIQFRLGPMSKELANASIRRFAEQVIPEVNARSSAG